MKDDSLWLEDDTGINFSLSTTKFLPSICGRYPYHSDAFLKENYYITVEDKTLNKKITQEGNAKINHTKKAVIIDMMKTVGEIASKIWHSCLVFNPFRGNFDLDLYHKHLGHCAFMG